MKIDNSWYVRPKGFKKRIAAGGIVVRENGRGIEILLTSNDDHEPWALPKGGVEPGEKLIEAALREIEEETGAHKLIKLAKLGVKERQTYEKNFWSVIHYYLFTTEAELSKPTDTECEYYPEWFPINELPEMFWPEQKELIMENKDKIRKLLEKLST